jgi:hypothetical protein
MFEDLLVVLDGRASGERIVGWIRRLCGLSRARVRLLVVRSVEGTVWRGAHPVAFASQLEDAARLESLAYLEGIAASLESPGIRVSAEVRFGSLVDVVLEVARSSGAKLVALAAGRAPRRDPLDRIARELLHRAPIAVLVARARDQRAA